MNEKRVYELVKLATERKEFPHEMGGTHSEDVFDAKRFAELIILECAKIAMDCMAYHESLSSVPNRILAFERLTDEKMGC
jgi:hypothetical protein